jgi:hypothetical protein
MAEGSRSTELKLQIGVAFGDRGTAIVFTEWQLTAAEAPGRQPGWRAMVVHIERLGPDDTAALARLTEIAKETVDDDPFVTFDAEGMGRSVRQTLQTRRQQDREQVPLNTWPRLYEGAGKARQALADILWKTKHLGQLNVVAGIPHGDDLSRALTTYQRNVGDDGALGGELVVALALTLLRSRAGAFPRAVGRSGKVYHSVEAAQRAGAHDWY